MVVNIVCLRGTLGRLDRQTGSTTGSSGPSAPLFPVPSPSPSLDSPSLAEVTRP